MYQVQVDEVELAWAVECAMVEYRRARQSHNRMRGMHEGYAVLLEEVDEVWEEIKRKGTTKASVRKEMVQVAAMAIAFLVEVAPEVK